MVDIDVMDFQLILRPILGTRFGKRKFWLGGDMDVLVLLGGVSSEKYALKWYIFVKLDIHSLNQIRK